MLAGFGKSNVTPDLGLELTGYGYYLERKALSVRDELFVRAVAIENGDTRLMLISHDVSAAMPDALRRCRFGAKLLRWDILFSPFYLPVSRCDGQ